jgi:hypothetical protein
MKQDGFGETRETGRAEKSKIEIFVPKKSCLSCLSCQKLNFAGILSPSSSFTF